MASQMSLRRRNFIARLGGAAAVWPLAVLAQQQLPVIGFLSSASVSASATAVPTAFRKGLSQKGFVPGQNVIIETRQAEGHYEVLAAHADDLISIPVKVIVAAGGAASARATMEATKTIPVLFIAGFDPVKLGFVSSFNRPGGNATGFLTAEFSIGGKWLELVKQIAPGVTRVAVLRTTTHPPAFGQFAVIQAMASSLAACQAEPCLNCGAGRDQLRDVLQNPRLP
jgi:putative ABC transport system substrate-binding protein